MINLYKSNETNFNHNAYVLNEIITCDVTEEINSGYEANLEYPLNDYKNISSLLIPESIVKLPSYDERDPQLFVIRRAVPDIESSTVNCYAQAISIAKLENNVVLDTNIVNKIRRDAVQQILSNTLNLHKFTIGNKDTNTTLNNLRIVRYSALTALKGDKDNTILNRYGGEFIPDNFTVDFVDTRGKDNGVTVSYAKNITGAKLTLEDIDKTTEIIPVGKDGLMLSEKSVRAYNFDINNPFTKFIEFNDIGVVEAEYDENNNCTNPDEVCTLEQAYAKLRQACLDKFNIEHANEVSFNLTLNFIELEDCIDFEGNDYSQIQNKRVAIGDTITVNIGPLNIKQKGRVYKLTRDHITGRLKSAEIGYKKANIATTINKTNNTANEAKQAVAETKEDLKKSKKEITVKIEALEGAIELSVTEEDLWSLIEMNPGKILLAVNDEKNGTDVIVNVEGLEVHKGKFRIYNVDGDKIFAVNQSGRVLIYEMLEIANDVGDYVDVKGSGIGFWNLDSYLARVDCISDMNGMLVLESKNGDVSIQGNNIIINDTKLEDLIDERIAASS